MKFEPYAKVNRQDEDDNGLVIFSRKNFADLANHFQCTDQELISRFQGVQCGNLEDNEFTIGKMRAVLANGTTKTILVIGLSLEKCVRFLNENEPLFSEFLQNHPLYNFIDWADNPVKSEEIFNQIAEEYKQQNLAG